MRYLLIGSNHAWEITCGCLLSQTCLKLAQSCIYFDPFFSQPWNLQSIGVTSSRSPKMLSFGPPVSPDRPSKPLRWEQFSDASETISTAKAQVCWQSVELLGCKFSESWWKAIQPDGRHAKTESSTSCLAKFLYHIWTFVKIDSKSIHLSASLQKSLALAAQHKHQCSSTCNVVSGQHNRLRT